MEGWLEREVVVWRMRVALEANDAARPGSASSNTKRMDSIEPHPCIAQRISDDLPHTVGRHLPGNFANLVTTPPRAPQPHYPLTVIQLFHVTFLTSSLPGEAIYGRQSVWELSGCVTGALYAIGKLAACEWPSGLSACSMQPYSLYFCTQQPRRDARAHRAFR